jgi:hypothetical protein
VPNNRVVLGHFETRSGWVVDATSALTVAPSYTMVLTIKGTSASVTVNGAFALSLGFNAGVVDGRFGLMTRGSSATFTSLRVRSDDQQLSGIAPPSSAVDVSVADVTVIEGGSGTTSAVVTVVLSAPTNVPVVVPWTIVGGTASAGSDYSGTSGTVTVAAGATSATFTVGILGDTLVEADETFQAVLGTVTGANVTRGTATVTIHNDDLPTVAIGSASVNEGGKGITTSATLTLTLSQASTAPVTVVVSRTGGTATSGTDFVAFSPATVTFAAGETSRTVTVQVIGDVLNEANETVVLGLSAVIGAVLGNATATLTIVNDDSKLVAASVGRGTTSRLSTRRVNQVLRAALGYWRAHGATARQLAGIRVLQTRMAGTDLAEAVGRTIHLDTDAAGWGWSTAARSARGRMHLFSVLVHEIGHVLGRSHTHRGVMEPVLRPGQVLAVPLSRRARR